jgi:4'-phosphopantetheinyl transferase
LKTITYCSADILLDSEVDKYIKVIPSFMQDEISGYRNLKDRKAKVLSKLMLQQKLLESGFSLFDYRKSIYGKPHISGFRHFNVSHSSDLVVLVMSDYTDLIGVDVEKYAKLSCHDVMNVFHSKEIEYIESQNHNLGIYDIWTKKEALFKAVGTGINGDFQSANCVPDQIAYGNRSWHFLKIDIHLNYSCHICFENKLDIIEYQFIESILELV